MLPDQSRGAEAVKDLWRQELTVTLRRWTVTSAACLTMRASMAARAIWKQLHGRAAHVHLAVEENRVEGCLPEFLSRLMGRRQCGTRRALARAETGRIHEQIRSYAAQTGSTASGGGFRAKPPADVLVAWVPRALRPFSTTVTSKPIEVNINCPTCVAAADKITTGLSWHSCSDE